LNFNIVDNNADVLDVNIELYYYKNNVLPGAATQLVNLADWNGDATTSSDYNCTGASWASPGKDCTYVWTMPLNTTLSDGEYRIDANVLTYERAAAENNLYDANGTRIINIQNRLATMGATQSLVQNSTIIIAAAVLLSILGIGVFVRPDPKTFVVMSTVIAIAGGIGAMIVGIIAGIM